VQADAIPPAMEGRDVLGCAQTGSGKTAAFLLPILNRLLGKPRGRTRALIVAPTRELAAQILEEFNALATHTPLTGASVFGGVGMGPQEHAFRAGVDVIIATPGRLLDHLRAPYVNLSHLECLVLDEADRMLDMGFLPDIRRILRVIPQKRQTLFFSATMPPEIAKLTAEMLHNPVTIQRERQAAPASGITQAVYPVQQDLKPALLVHLLNTGQVKQALVFTRTKHRANRVADYLVRSHVKAERIHGNRSQAQRTAALAGFKSGTYPVLVATDIAARGIDVEGISHVINFDFPMHAEDYVHRIGRTGRAQAVGDAISFVTSEDHAALRTLERFIGRGIVRKRAEGFNYQSSAPPATEAPRGERRFSARSQPQGRGARRDGGQSRGHRSGGRRRSYR